MNKTIVNSTTKKRIPFNLNKNTITPRNEESINRYFNEINGKDCAPNLTKKDEKDLHNLIKQGDREAKEKLIKSNLRFVISVAKNYLNQGLAFEDLINEGNIGLIRAIDSFDPTKNIKFLSYAVWWIRQAIIQSLLDNGRTVRVPINKKESLSLVNKMISKLEQNLQRQPTINEIVEYSEELGKPFDTDDIGNILRSKITHVSFDCPVVSKNDEDISLYDVIPSDMSLTQEKSQEILEEIKNILSKLEPEEKVIMEMYFGVVCERKYTLDEIGEVFNLTRERIRQIKDKAVRKLRNNPEIRDLYEYVNID